MVSIGRAPGEIVDPSVVPLVLTQERFDLLTNSVVRTTIA